MKAQILNYAVPHSKKKLLLVGNGNPSSVFAIQLGKTFTPKDAEQIIKAVNTGQF
ncbi:MAG: hypothetical protein NWF06_03750 [Candidatus Bathyarchaeota archaeon]|nr:hypothetical protein [Candidatus Bathyarchaeum sp.]